MDEIQFINLGLTSNKCLIWAIRCLFTSFSFISSDWCLTNRAVFSSSSNYQWYDFNADWRKISLHKHLIIQLLFQIKVDQVTSKNQSVSS